MGDEQKRRPQAFLAVLPLLLAGACSQPPRTGPATATSAATATATSAATAEEVDLVYQPPWGVPAGGQSIVREATPLALLREAERRAGELGLKTERIDRERKLLVVTGQITPQNVVDCGTLSGRALGGGPVQPAMLEWLTLDMPDGNTGRARLERRMEAFVRLVVRAEPLDDKRSLLRSDGQFVLIKQEGRVGGPVEHSEVAAFRSSESGRFGKGTVCQSSGWIERQIVAAKS